MFKKGDRVIHKDYGTGEVWRIDCNKIIKYNDKNNQLIYHKGVIYVAFDSEMGEDDGKGGQKTLLFLSDGRETPIGSGYFHNAIFNEFDSTVELTKINNETKI